jgi:hypothetical protein
MCVANTQIRYQSTLTASHKMKTALILLLIVAVGLLLLVGKYAETSTCLTGKL